MRIRALVLIACMGTNLPPQQTKLDAVRAATVNAATAFRLADSLGVLTSGRIADIIAVEGDPLSDLDALKRVRFVMSRGKVKVTGDR
jgi:imidazolonepropionase-like amidohydrolase